MGQVAKEVVKRGGETAPFLPLRRNRRALIVYLGDLAKKIAEYTKKTLKNHKKTKKTHKNVKICMHLYKKRKAVKIC